MSGYQDNFGVILRFESDLPHEVNIFVKQKSIIRQWCSQNVKGIKIPLSIFLSNSNGYPILSK